jgi:coenzyme F420-reducing hydrogenase delta subunit
MEQCAKFILSLPANSKQDWETLISAGVSLDNMNEEDIDNMTVVNAAIIAAAKSGDVAAFKALRDVIRDDERLKIEKERLKLEKQKLADKNDNSDVFAKLDDVLEKIGSDPS